MKDVRIEIAEDESRYFGNALITFHGVELTSAPVRIFLARKSTDTPYLGADSWQANPAPLEVELISQMIGKTVVRAGPDICDKVPYSLFVRVQIEGTEITGQAFWPEIMQSPRAYTEVLGDFKSPETTKLVPTPEPQAVVPPPPELEPPPTAAVPVAPSPVVQAKKNKVWTYGLLLLLIVAACGSAYWKRDLFMQQHVEEVTAPVPVIEQPKEALSAKFERLKVSDADGAELFALSEEAFAAKDATIGQLAITEAINRGNESAKLQRAKWYDPRTYASDRAEAVDANAAARAYFELALGGNTEATELVKSICVASKAGGTDYRDFLYTTYCEGTLEP
ncbi:MAG: hypothetical protein ACRCSX_13770 [Allorhizobium sp.]